MRAQASLEYILLFGFSLLIVAILWVTSSSNIENTQWELQLAYAKNALEKIVQAADSTYVQGPPSRTYINVDLPDNTNAVYMSGNIIVMELTWKGILRNISSEAVANLTGYVSPAPGRHRLLVAAGPVVNITEA